MGDHMAARLAFGDAASNREGERNANEERERGLNEVVQGAAGPSDVRLVISEETPESAIRKFGGDCRQAQHFGHHQEHDKSTIGIDGSQPWRSWCNGWGGMQNHSRGSGRNFHAWQFETAGATKCDRDE